MAGVIMIVKEWYAWCDKCGDCANPHDGKPTKSDLLKLIKPQWKFAKGKLLCGLCYENQPQTGEQNGGNKPTN